MTNYQRRPTKNEIINKMKVLAMIRFAAEPNEIKKFEEALKKEIYDIEYNDEAGVVVFHWYGELFHCCEFFEYEGCKCQRGG